MRIPFSPLVALQSVDSSVFGPDAVFTGARLADALTQMRRLLREGSINRRNFDQEVEILIRNSQTAEAR